MRLPCWIYASVIVLGTSAVVAAQPPVSVPERVRGAERVVVAQVADVTATYETNEYGDRLIVSHVALAVEETLKGHPSAALSVDVDGGTLGGLTLEVSSLPKMNRGERAVFFVTQNKEGKYIPHLRGQGILKLDSQNRVRGSSLDLDAIRQMASSVAGR